MIMKHNCLIIGLVLILSSNSYAYSCDRTPENAVFPKTNHRYVIEVVKNPTDFYSPEKIYRIFLKSKPSSPFTSYFTQFILVVEPHDTSDIIDNVNSGELITIDSAVTRFTDKCRNAVVEVSDSVRKSSIEIMWKAPPSGNGCIAIKATVIENKENWYTDDGGLTKVLCEEKENIDVQDPYLEECSACDEAKYEVAFQRMWTRNTHPKDYPSNMWETKLGELIGASHANDKSFWNYYSMASDGLKLLAEAGNTSVLENELKELVKSEDVRTIIKARELSYPNITGTTYTVVRVDRKHHLISLVAKIVPSPDWIVGVANLELCTSNNDWKKSRTLNLYPWDVGTDNGTSYNSADVPIASPIAIQPITSDMEEYPFYDKDGEKIKPIAQLRITRLKLYRKDCEKSCEYSDWSEWSECSTTCGNEVKTRDRQVTDPETATECGETQETVQCDMTETNSTCEPTRCANATWSEWGPCTGSCETSSKTRQELRIDEDSGQTEDSCEAETVSCKMPGCDEPEATTSNEHESSSSSSHTKLVAQGPSYSKVVDCEVSEWSDWSECSATEPCSKGRQFKERHIEKHPNNGGKACPKKLQKSRRCQIPCATSGDCILGEWSNWSPCSSICGSSAIQQRTRPILVPPKKGGKPCGERLNTRNCHLPYACDDRELEKLRTD